MTTEILRPNSLELNDGSKWHASSGTSFWDLVDEASADDNDYVYDDDSITSKAGYRIRFGFPSPSSVSDGDTINSIKVYWRAKSINGAADATPFLYDGSNQDGTQVENIGTSYTTRNESIGSGWEFSDLADIEAGVNYDGGDGKSGGLYVSWFYIEIDYTAGSGPSVKLASTFVPDKFDTDRVASLIDQAFCRDKRFTHSGGADLEKEIVSRLTQGFNLSLVGPTKRIGNFVDFETYDAPWWDNDYYKRKSISFGTSHSVLKKLHEVSFEHYCGYEEKIPGGDNCVPNEGMHDLVHYDGYLYVTWLARPSPGANYRIYINRKNLSTDVWDTAVNVVDTGSYSDTHFGGTPFIDSNGVIHLVYGCHHSNIKYIRSETIDNLTGGEDLSDLVWTQQTDLSYVESPYTAAFTYPHMVEDKNGYLYIFARIGGGVAGQSAGEHWGYFKSTDGGDNWGNLQQVIDYSDNYWGAASVYATCLYYNNQFHVTINWHDHYGTSTQMTRACSYIYSNDGVYWYEKETAGSVGKANDWEPGVQHQEPTATYDDCSKIKRSSDAPWPATPQWPPGASGDEPIYAIWGGFNVDSDNNPCFMIYKYDDLEHFHIEVKLIFAKWNPSTEEWDFTEITSGGNPKIAHDRLGGGLVRHGNKFYFFLFAQPAGTEERFGMELVRYEGINYGASWSYQYMSKNTAFGAPLMFTLNPFFYPPSAGLNVILAYGRCNVGYLRENKFYPYAHPDGDDMRLIQTTLVNGSYTHEEIDRLPGDRFAAEDSLIVFGCPDVLGANEPHLSKHRRLWWYYNEPYETGEAQNDHSNIWPHYDGYEDITSDALLNTSSRWAGDNGFRVIAAYDWDVMSDAHTNKLWDGDKFAVLLQEEHAGAQNIRTPFTLDQHKVRIMMWNGIPADYGYVELYDSSSSKYIRIGIAGNSKFCYLKSGGSWTEVGTAKASGQYYECIFIITSTGVTATIDGETILDDDPHMTSATHFGLGCTGAAGEWCWDALYITHYVTNEPTLVLGSEEGEDNWGVERIAHSAALRFHRELRIGNSLTPVKYGDIRLMGDTNLEKMEIERVMGIIVGDKELALRLSDSLDLHYSDLIRKCNGSDLEKEEVVRLIQSTDMRKSDRLRLMGDTNLEKMEIERLTQGLLSQKHIVTRMHNKGDVSRMDILRIMDTLGLEKHEAERLCEIVVGDKEETVRSGQEVSGNKAARFRIGGMVDMQKHAIDQFVSGMELDKELTERVHNEADLIFARVIRFMSSIVGDKELSERISSGMGLHYSDLVRIKNDLVEQKHEFTRLASETIPDKVEIARLMSDISARYSDAVEIAQYSELEKEVTNRVKHVADVWNYESYEIANLIVGDKEEVVRLMDDIVLSKIERMRVSHGSASDKEEFIRVYNDVISDKELTNRMMSTLGLDKEEISRRADSLGLDKEELIFLCNISVMDKEDILQVSNSSSLHYINVIRIIHTIAADKEQSYRISNKPDLAPEAFIRLHQAFDLDKGEFTRQPSEVVVDKITTDRLMEWLALNKELSDRIAEGLDLDKENYGEIANAILTNKHVAVRVGSLPDVNKTLTYRISSDMNMDAERTSRLHHWTYLEIGTIIQFANTLGLDKEDKERLGNIVDFMEAESKRIHHNVFGFKISTTRFSEMVPLIRFVTTRISNSSDADKELVERLNHSLALDLMTTARETNLIVGNKVVRERINNSMSLHYSDMVQFASAMDLYKFTRGRISNSIAFYSVEIEGPHIEECVVVPLSMTDLSIETLKITDKVIETLKVTDREVQTNKMVDRIVEELKIDDHKLR